MIQYRLPLPEVRRRALSGAAVRAVTSLLPVLLAVVLLRRLGWQPSFVFWAVVGALVTLVLVRAVVGYGVTRRKLTSMVVTVEDDAVRVDGLREGWAIERGRIARILEIAGNLGGLRVESVPDPRSGVVFVVDVPRGGQGFPDVRAAIEGLGTIERRGRRGPAVRVAIGAMVVAGIFFLPFFLDDFVARSKLVAACLVAAAWLAMRATLRNR